LDYVTPMPKRRKCIEKKLPFTFRTKFVEGEKCSTLYYNWIFLFLVKWNYIVEMVRGCGGLLHVGIESELSLLIWVQPPISINKFCSFSRIRPAWADGLSFEHVGMTLDGVPIWMLLHDFHVSYLSLSSCRARFLIVHKLFHNWGFSVNFPCPFVTHRTHWLVNSSPTPNPLRVPIQPFQVSTAESSAAKSCKI